MKLSTALRYANEIARRVHEINGLLETPTCDYRAVQFHRIWVFGSTVKGSVEPNDLDVMIDMVPVGPRQTIEQGARLDKRELRSHGFRMPVGCEHDAFVWLTKGMKKISRHRYQTETSFFDQEVDVKVLIYPRNDLPTHFHTR